MIDAENLDIYYNEYELLSRYSTMISSIQNNLSILTSNYKEILVGLDLKKYTNLANISQKLLYETSKKLGNNIAIDTLNIEIDNKDREIEDLTNSFQILNDTELPKVVSSDQENNTNDNSLNNTPQSGGAVFV